MLRAGIIKYSMDTFRDCNLNRVCWVIGMDLPFIGAGSCTAAAGLLHGRCANLRGHIFRSSLAAALPLKDKHKNGLTAAPVWHLAKSSANGAGILFITLASTKIMVFLLIMLMYFHSFGNLVSIGL